VLRVVLDTNDIISGTILSTGPPAEIMTAWHERRFEVVAGPSNLAELDRVLRLPKIARAYSLDPQDVRDLLELLSARAVLVSERRAISAALRDPKDLPILGCALEGHADYVVTGDRDLLALGRFQEIPILSPAAFAALLEADA